MFIDDLVNHVHKRWYALQWAAIGITNSLLVVGYLITRSVPEYAPLGQALGLNNAVLFLSPLVLFYLFVLFWFVARKSLAFAIFIASILNAIPMLNMLDQTNQSIYSLPYIAIWIFLTFINGMYGPTILLGSFLTTAIYLTLEIEFDASRMTGASMFFLVGSILAVVLGHFFWRNRFIDKQAEKVIRLTGLLSTKEQQSAIIIQSIADGIIVTNTEGKITLINKAACDLTGWTENDAINFDVRSVLKLRKDEKTVEPIDDTEHPFTKVLQSNSQFNQTLLLANKNSQNIFISLVVSPVILPNSQKPTGAVAVFRNVSKQKKEEQQRAEFISTASHEMRTPVAAIEGYLALALNDKVSKIDSKAREYLEKAHVSTQHLGKLFQDLLTSAKAEDGRLVSHPAVVEVGSFVEQLVEDLRFGAQKKGLAVEYVTNSISTTENGIIDASSGSTNKNIEPLYYTYVDPDRIREVVTNIFDNAVKYTEEGKISIGLTGNQEVVQISIKDTGPGIPPEDLPHLFQKFYRVDNSATRSIGGTGLGLFICRKIIELYNGSIWAESEVGKGSTFYINLPRISAQKADQLKMSEKPASLA